MRTHKYFGPFDPGIHLKKFLQYVYIEYKENVHMNIKNAVIVLSVAVCVMAGQAAFAQKILGPEGSKMELKWPDFKFQKDTADSSSQPAQPFYIKGPEGRMMDLGNLTKIILQRRALEAKKQQEKNQKDPAANTKKEDKVPFYLMGREGHMMQLGETVRSLKKNCKKAKDEASKEDKKEPQPQPKKEKSMIEKLSEPGRLQAL